VIRRINPKTQCHAERSSEAGEARVTAESKHPYPQDTLEGRDSSTSLGMTESVALSLIASRLGADEASAPT